jgi:hypothetical protein
MNNPQLHLSRAQLDQIALDVLGKVDENAEIFFTRKSASNPTVYDAREDLYTEQEMLQDDIKNQGYATNTRKNAVADAEYTLKTAQRIGDHDIHAVKIPFSDNIQKAMGQIGLQLGTELVSLCDIETQEEYIVMNREYPDPDTAKIAR